MSSETQSVHLTNTVRSHHSFEILGKSIPVIGSSGVSDEEVRLAIESIPFKQWRKNLESSSGLLKSGNYPDAECSLLSVTIQGIDKFGSRVGFVKFKAKLIDNATQAELPGIVFARGGAVGILILLSCKGETFAVLTEQARVPVGRSILELPAGMLDEDAGDFVGTAAKEVEEEVGIKINVAQLIDLTSFLDLSTGQKMFPSPGGCDEEITLYLYQGEVDKQTIEQLNGKETGLRSHGELIKVRIVPFADLWKASADAKVLAALTLYRGGKESGLL